MSGVSWMGRLTGAFLTAVVVVSAGLGLVAVDQQDDERLPLVRLSSEMAPPAPVQEPSSIYSSRATDVAALVASGAVTVTKP